MSEKKAETEATCKTCPFFCPDAVNDGYCQRSPPTSDRDTETVWPKTSALSSFWCGEHPLRQRDRLAAMAMQGLMAAGWTQDSSAGDLADIAYSQADAMLAAAEVRQP
jgi:hypothetical protein